MIKKRFSHNFKIFKFFDQKNLGSLPRIFLSSIIIMFFFYTMPIFVNYKKNNNFEFKNNSKTILAYTLNNKKNGVVNENLSFDEKDLLVDIFSLNDLETDSVRLSASTINQLFEDTDYKLDDVRKKKLVKPVALTLLPQEIKMIESTKKEKNFLFKSFYL